jgi:hypothetical protein
MDWLYGLANGHCQCIILLSDIKQVCNTDSEKIV